MEERANINTVPKPILDWLMFPYKSFSEILGSEENTLLDFACGNNLQYDILKSKFKNVYSIDNEATGDNIIKDDLVTFNKNITADITFCFETIEHIEPWYHNQCIKNLINATNKTIIIGSVNRSGPIHLDGYEIYKSELNPYHKFEYDHLNFSEAFNYYLKFFDVKIDYYGSTYTNNTWQMQSINENSVSNYAVIYKNI